MIDFTYNPIIPADYKSRGRGLPYEASPFWSNLYYQKRKAVEPEQYLGADEIPLQESRSKSQQGVSPQSAQAICTNLLWY